MIPSNNLSILPFYSALEKQNHRKDYAFGEIFPLFTPDKRILPFQIIRQHATAGVSQAKIFDKNGNFISDLITELNATGLVINQYVSKGYDIIQYHGKLPLTTSLPEGQYYLRLYEGTTYWYSEIFTIVRKVDDYLKIEYGDLESLEFDAGMIDYTNAFKFMVYIPTQIGRPDYDFEEELENRDGFKFIEKQISEKTYKFVFLAPEFLCDALRVVRMSDSINITSKGENYSVDSFLMTPKWQDGGYLASVEVEFQCNTIIKKIGTVYTPINMGDYNADYNNDYLNS